MILFDNVTHYAKIKKQIVLENVSLALPTDRRIAFFGLRGSGRSTVVRLVNGMATPRHGTIVRPPGISFAIGGVVAMAPKLTVAQYVQDIARLYGANYHDVIDCIVEWGDAEGLLRRPVGKLNKTELSRVMLPLAYALPFNFYVVDGDPLGAAPKFRDPFRDIFKRRIAETGLLYAAPKPTLAAAMCDAGLIIHEGQLIYFDNITEALELYQRELEPLETPEGDEEDDAVAPDARTREPEQAPDVGVFF